jgi:cytochrome b subunit of formate dehydrogenase
VKRFALALFILLSWLALIGAASAQTIGGEGWPEQTALFTDARFLARAAPFLIALGIIVGVVQARAAARGGGDAILGEQVRRHDLGTVLAHWMNAVGVFLCLVTGAMVLRWVGRGLELRLVFVIHYCGAALILFAIFNHLARHGVSGGTGLIPKGFSVIRDAIGELLEYAGLFGPEGAALRFPWPKALRQPIAKYVRALLGYKPYSSAKFLPTEQVLSYAPWALWLSLIVITGSIKVLKYVYALPGSLVATATAVHDIVALIIGVSIVIHVLPLLLVPANWPLLLSMFKTTVPRKYAQDRHPLWYRELQAKASSPTPSATGEEAGSERGAGQVAGAPSGD